MSNVLKYYEYLHTIPELGFQEEKTSAFIAEKLREFGYDVKDKLDGKTGIVATWDSGVEGPTVGVRADMDALGHVIDGKPCARHTCGHDGHSSMVLTVAEEFKKKNLLKKGKVKFIFQPAEELGTGAQTIVNSGEVDDIDWIFGAHVRPGEEAPKGKAVPAMYYASSGRIYATIKGVLSHAARPHLGINAIDAAVLAINAVNAIHLKPTESWSMKPTRFICDSGVTNSVPDTAKVVWDVRAQYNPIMDELQDKVLKAITLAVESIGATVELNNSERLVAAIIDDDATQLLRESIVEVLGEDGLMDPVITPGGEDFFTIPYSNPKVKAGFFGLGCDLAPGLHHPDMHFDTSSLEIGVDIFITTLKKLVG